MKVTIVVALTLAFVASTYAAPEPAPEALARAAADALANPGKNPLKKLAEVAKKLYSYACEDKEGNDRCKQWLKENITVENVKKIGIKLRPYVVEFCNTSDSAKDGALKLACELYQQVVKDPEESQ